MDFVRLTTKSKIEADGLKANMAHALSLGRPLLSVQPEKEGRVAIVGGGPSIRTQVRTIREFDEVWCVNGSLNWCLDHDIKPTVWLAIDPQPGRVVRHLCRAPEYVRYYVASHCDKDVFERLENRDVWIWHSGHPEALPPRKHLVVPGGPTVLTRAPYVAHMQGYREIHMFGADGSFSDQSHGYGGGIPEDAFQVRVGPRVFLTRAPYMHATAYLCRMVETFPGKLIFHGDGMCQALMSSPVRDMNSPEDDYLVAVQ